MAPKDTSRTSVSAEQQSLDQTELYPVAAPSYDEEHGTGIGEVYEQDFSRMGKVRRRKRGKREAVLPRMDDQDGTGYRIPGEGKSRSRLRPLFALVLVGIMAGVIFAAASYGLEAWGGTTVPDVVGISEARARAALDEAGFAVETKNRIADDGIGHVLDQSPAKGTRLKEGEPVTIVIAVSRTVPEVVGLTQDEATDLLSKAGAENIEIQAVDSSEPEGTVISCTPAAGESFSARSTITLTVAQMPLVPDVIGKEKVEATAAIERAGFYADVRLVSGEGQGEANTVYETDPVAGSKLEPGSTVYLYVVEPMPSDPLHVLEYFGRSTPNLAAYLNNQGFYLYSSFISSDDEAEAMYWSDDYGYLCFCNRPYSSSYIRSNNTGEDVLVDGYQFVGIRWEVPAELLPADASKLTDSAMHEIMTRCGLSNITDVCSQDDVQTPSGTQKSKASFRCTLGEVGGNSWTVLLANEGDGTRAVVTCAPTSYYKDNYDLEPYGDSICDFVACAEVYADH